MVVQIEELIIVYCMTKEKVTNLCSREGEEESPYSIMRNLHLRDWPYRTFQIKDDGHSETISEQQLELKHFIALC